MPEERETQPEKIIKESYLGDAVYGSFDGYHVMLRVADMFSGDKIIYLDPRVSTDLIEYIKKCYGLQ